MAAERLRLPVDDALPRLHDALGRQTIVVLQAPPGTGKTTRVPPSLLDQPWLEHDRVVVLEPRRVAARAAAQRMAGERGEKVGQTIGLRTRNDTRVGSSTRVEVVTEGVLTRMLLADPSLDGVGAVVFDEFHERSLHADTALAFVRETQSALRPDLRLVLMSATLDAHALATRLRTDAVVAVVATTHPVDVVHRPPAPGENVETAAVGAVVAVIDDASHVGDVLVFLPGAGAINRVERDLRRRLRARIGHDIAITPLHGSLPAAQQDAALRPDPDGRRKVILSTPIAETSVTIDGVATVVDAGLRRRPEIDHGRGMSRLRTVTASRAAADQRAGRAGRQRPGTCVRLWAAVDDQHRPPDEPAEIDTADLTGLALDLAVWGAADPTGLPWLDPPPPIPIGEARATLQTLGAIDSDHRVTPHGRAMHALGAEPRLAHLMVSSVELEHEQPGAIATATALAALLADRDILRGRDRPVDLRRRLDVLAGAHRAGQTDRQAISQAEAAATRWRRMLDSASTGATEIDTDLAGVLVSLAFPDRIARRREEVGSFLLASGAGVRVSPDDDLARHDWLAVAETDGVGADARVVTAAPLLLSDVETHHSHRMREADHGGWDRRANDAVFERRTQLGALVVHRRPAPAPDREAVVDALLLGVRRQGLRLLAWDDAATRFRDRLSFAHGIEPGDWPGVDDRALLDDLESWLGPHLSASSRRRDVEALDVAKALESMLDWRHRKELDRLVPTHAVVPSGSRLPIDYGAEGGPVLAVRLQEVFGLAETPTVFGGRVPLVLHLLSPAHRPVQVTVDLASFWADGYAEVRKELRGRYPKHHWPDDPTTAPPTNRAKRRG